MVKGFIALAKGDWVGLEALAGKICEFNTKKILEFAQLLKKMRIITEGEAELQQIQKSALVAVKEKIEQGAGAEAIFHMLDTDGS